MLIWHWKLLLATVVGVLVMWLVYRIQTQDWQRYWSTLGQFWREPNRQLTIAVGSGALACLGLYTAISIGVDTDSSWMGIGAMLQGLGTLCILVLLVWQIIGRQTVQDETQIDALLADLMDAEPLKRLIAVRQLTKLATKTQFDKADHRSIVDCFRLMLAQESETVVRNAILDGLQALQKVPNLRPGAPAYSVPDAVKQRATVKLRSR